MTGPPQPVSPTQAQTPTTHGDQREVHDAALRLLVLAGAFVGDPTMTALGVPDTGSFSMPGLPSQPARSKSRRGLWAAIIALSLVVLAAGTGFAYSSNSARTWHDTATRTATELVTAQRQRDELKTQLSSTQSELEGAKKELGDITGKYKEATDRIRALANEKAQVGDTAAYLAETVAISDSVTKELGSCVDNLQTLQGYLVNFQNYDAAELIKYATDINDACDQARTDNAILADRLRGL